MRERHFMEDENELPYLVWETRDSKPSKPYIKNNKKNLDDILTSLNLNASQKRILKDKIIEFSNAKDCTDLTVDFGLGGCEFIFTRKNRYIETVDTFEYDPSFETSRIFRDCFTTHSHERLLKSPEFQQLIRKVGLEFTGCSGGYESKYSMADDEFNLVDEINVKVNFREVQNTDCIIWTWIR